MSLARLLGAAGDAGGLDLATLSEVRAALEAGAAPAAAVAAAAADGPLASVARFLRLGRSLADAAAEVDTGDAGADLLVRALGVAERAGTGAVTAVDQAIEAAREEADLARMLRTRTAQARGTMAVLAAVPALAWLLLVAMHRSALAFYTTVPGLLTAVAAVGLAGGGLWWSRRIVGRAQRAAAEADPLTPSRPPLDLVRLLALAVPAFVTLGVVLGWAVGLAAAGAAAAVGARRPAPLGAGRTRPAAAESAELLAMGLAAGLGTPAAVALVAPLAPPAAAPALSAAGRRLRGGWDADAAFADTGLELVGRVLCATGRWGAPAAPALRRLADDLRAARRAAAEQAAERTQLALVFPTTLLTLPAFVLAVVPPMLWAAFTQAGG